MDNRLLRASFGTTKYWSFFLKGQKWLNKDCLYLHKWHSDSETYTKEEMNNKKIFSDQQEIAIKIAGISTLTREEFKAAWEQNAGPIPEDSKFPNVLEIYDKFSSLNGDKSNSKFTPKKISSKINQIELADNSTKLIEEIKDDSELQMSDSKHNKNIKLEKSNQQAQLDIENKIMEANNLIKTKEGKRDGSGNKKVIWKNNSPSTKGKPDDGDKTKLLAHQNPHIQLKDTRLREGEDKRAVSGGRHDNYVVPAHSPSAREPTTVEKYTLFGHSDDSTIWKTPQTEQAFAKAAAYVVSPYFFKRNAESRFSFARSMDPRAEAEYFNIPEEVQEILERNIRNMSNKADKSSIDNTSSTDIIDFREDWLFALDKLRFEDCNSMYFASRRSSPHNKHPRYNLSPRSQLNKKSGSLTKRKSEDYMIDSMSNQLWSRTSMHSKPDNIQSSGGWYRYDSETTSNNDFRPDNNFSANFREFENLGRK